MYYTCSLCGDAHAREEIYRCSLGHIFCKEAILASKQDILKAHIQEAIIVLEKIEPCDPILKAKLIKEKREDLIRCNEETNIKDLWNATNLTFHFPCTLCPLCTMKSFTDYDLFRYLLKTNDMIRSDLEEDIRNNFLSYNDFVKFYNTRRRS